MHASGKVALITGAGSGIGQAVALALIAAGYHVVLAGRRLGRLEDTAARAAGYATRGVPVATDVSHPESVQRLFEITERTFGRLDLLFNNAGCSSPDLPLEEVSLDQWRAVVDVNLTGAFLCTRHAFLLMKRQQPRGGRIINNGSISAHVPRPHSVAYAASKHAITGLTKSTSLEGRKYDIACSQIDIGNAATDMARRHATGTLQPNFQLAPEPLLDLDHVVRAVLYMASLPLEANVQFLTIVATKMPFMGRG